MSKHVGKEFISSKTYPSADTPIIVGKPINGATVNGLEYLLDDKNQPMEFSTEQEARKFLTDQGLPEEVLEDLIFERSETELSDINRGEKAIVESFDEKFGLYKVLNLSTSSNWFMVSEETLESLMASL